MHEHHAHHQSKIEGSSNRSFGFVFTVFFLIVGLLPLLHGEAYRLWALVLSGLFLLLALAVPAVLSPLNRIWMKFGLVLHSIVSPLALGILFFLVVTPTGLLMRLFRKDPLRLNLDKSATSYWIDRQPPGPAPESLKQPF